MKRYGLILFVLSFLIFNLNLNITGSGDNTPTRLLPFNLLSGYGIFLDDYLPYLPKDPYYLQKFNEHLISSYPILPGIVATLFYLPIYLFLHITNFANTHNFYWVSFVAEKLSASLLASFSTVAFYFLFLAIFQNRKRSFIFALIFAFATQTFSISSQHLWQHTFTNLFLILSFYFFVRKKLILSLLSATLCLFSRNIFMIYLPILLFMIMQTDLKKWKIYLSIAFSSFLIFGLINYYLYNTLIGSEAVSVKYFAPYRFFSNIAVLTISPARGFIFYTPFFAFAFASILFWKKIVRDQKIFLINLFLLYGIFFAYTLYGLIDDGWVWGNRYLTDIAVPAVILSFYFIKQARNRLLTIVFILTIIWSIITQIIGTFYYPKGNWNSYPNNITYNLERLWDISDNPLARNFLAGPQLRGYDIIYNSFFNTQDNNFFPCSPEELIRNDRHSTFKIRAQYKDNVLKFECKSN
jgi:hypothetical protein